MTSFEEREKAFEDKYKHDQHLQFKITVRRNRMLALWVAGEIGLTGAAAEAYAKELVEEVAIQGGQAAAVAKIKADLTAHGRDASEHRLKAELARLTEVAKRQVMAE
jgi:hypothetical protein